MEKVLQLKIYLEEMPQIWRRFLVKDNINFHKLHEIIQKIMGWENYHLYEFNVDGYEFGQIDDDALDSNPDLKDSEKTKLFEYLNSERQKFNYLYDFGDSWEHKIVVEKILEKNSEEISEYSKYPVCMGGEKACPPEDCGGIWGYEEILEIMKDKAHPDYKEKIVNWLGESFNPEEFDIKKINERL